MTNLSPAAQAVFWEFNRAASGKPDDWHYLPAIAAALRAAADQIEKQMELPNVDGSKYAGMWHAVDHLMNLAAELEGNIE
jgi:hypothetical protein